MNKAGIKLSEMIGYKTVRKDIKIEEINVEEVSLSERSLLKDNK
jgi:hypothetical protein